MRYVFYALCLIAALVALVMVWLRRRVQNAAKRRDDICWNALEPIGRKVAARESVTAEEVYPYAKQPHLRRFLYLMLKQMELAELFPKEFLTPRAQAECAYAYWTLHANEMGAVPNEMELLKVVHRQEAGMKEDYFVFRFRMPEGHWAHKNKWMVCVAGPFSEISPPYQGSGSAFNRNGDLEGNTDPDELVDWFIKATASGGVMLEKVTS